MLLEDLQRSLHFRCVHPLCAQTAAYLFNGPLFPAHLQEFRGDGNGCNGNRPEYSYQFMQKRGLTTDSYYKCEPSLCLPAGLRCLPPAAACMRGTCEGRPLTARHLPFTLCAQTQHGAGSASLPDGSPTAPSSPARPPQPPGRAATRPSWR